jgi:branched-chain amino acid transport system substrate-binding protein
MVMAATLDKISAPVSPYIFTATPAGAQDGLSMIKFVLSNPKNKKVAIIHHTDDWANAKLGLILEEIKKSGVQLVAQEVMDRNVTDATAQVLKIKAANPDVVIFVTYPGESAVFLRDALKFGLGGPFVGSNSVMDLHDLATRAGSKDAVKNVYVAAFLKGPVDGAGMKDYVDMMKKYFPGDKIQSLNFYGMQGAFVVVDALKRAGKALTRESFLKALNETKDFPAMSNYCTTTFSPDNHQGCHAEQMWTMKDDVIVPVGDKWPQ